MHSLRLIGLTRDNVTIMLYPYVTPFKKRFKKTFKSTTSFLWYLYKISIIFPD